MGEVTFSALASEPVKRSLWSDSDPIPHTRLGQSADLIVVVPATARFLGSYAAGISDGLLTATVLATRAPVVVCPAMHTEMWEHPAVQENLATLTRRGVIVVPPGEGRLAGGDAGPGRLAEPGRHRGRRERRPRRRARPVPGPGTRDLDGRTVVVSAGGTREPIDPVRYISNRSSGKQGHALAQAAADRGAPVVLVTTTKEPVPAGATGGPGGHGRRHGERPCSSRRPRPTWSSWRPPWPTSGPRRRRRPSCPRPTGCPRSCSSPPPTSCWNWARRRRPGQVLVGFAAETGPATERAAAKLVAKGVDLMVANDVSAPGVGFDHETNAVTVLGRDGSRREVGLSSKRQVADAVLDAVVALLG